jgi:hypothetical protein
MITPMNGQLDLWCPTVVNQRNHPHYYESYKPSIFGILFYWWLLISPANHIIQFGTTIPNIIKYMAKYGKTCFKQLPSIGFNTLPTNQTWQW